jgi:hypothetical protein
MRCLGPTTRMACSGRGAGRWLLPALVGAVLSVGLAVWGGGLAATEGPSRAGGAVPAVEAGGDASGPRFLTRRATRQPACVRFHGVGFDTWAALHGARATVSPHPVWHPARGRGGFPLDTAALLRLSRTRRETLDTAIARRVRYPVGSVSARGGLADRPPIVTRPLRGPPALG